MRPRAHERVRFDPHTVDRIVDEVARWRIPRSRAKKIVDAYDQGGRTPAEVCAALMADYLFALPAARGALAHAAAGGTAHLLVIGPAEDAPAVHGTEMYALVGQEQPGRGRRGPEDHAEKRTGPGTGRGSSSAEPDHRGPGIRHTRELPRTRPPLTPGSPDSVVEGLLGLAAIRLRWGQLGSASAPGVSPGRRC